MAIQDHLHPSAYENLTRLRDSRKRILILTADEYRKQEWQRTATGYGLEVQVLSSSDEFNQFTDHEHQTEREAIGAIVIGGFNFMKKI